MKFTSILRKLIKSDDKIAANPKKSSKSRDILKFENVKQKIDNVWHRKTIIIRKNADLDFQLYILANSAYSYYEVYDLSKNFVEQLFDNTSRKTQILLVEAAISLKFQTLSDKWRMVEFLRANMSNPHILSTSGQLIHRPNSRAKTGQNVRCLIKSTCLYIIDYKENRVIAHVNLKLHVGFMSCVGDELYFTKLRKSQICADNKDFWSIRIGAATSSIDNLWREMARNHRFENLDQYFKFVRIFRVK
ncbi:unnamed protein product [Caenorhabditis angaria]|uniref:Uncharacterized protein n=1 Tax=Caenorhabditis angaria TaxID=860376 RepID=A0A9P1IL88_9PELO|nr:unnamed protein product [Caenorhabditis angaria]